VLGGETVAGFVAPDRGDRGLGAGAGVAQEGLAPVARDEHLRLLAAARVVAVEVPQLAVVGGAAEDGLHHVEQDAAVGTALVEDLLGDLGDTELALVALQVGVHVELGLVLLPGRLLGVEHAARVGATGAREEVEGRQHLDGLAVFEQPQIRRTAAAVGRHRAFVQLEVTDVEGDDVLEAGGVAEVDEVREVGRRHLAGFAVEVDRSFADFGPKIARDDSGLGRGEGFVLERGTVRTDLIRRVADADDLLHREQLPRQVLVVEPVEQPAPQVGLDPPGPHAVEHHQLEAEVLEQIRRRLVEQGVERRPHEAEIRSTETGAVALVFVVDADARHRADRVDVQRTDVHGDEQVRIRGVFGITGHVAVLEAEKIGKAVVAIRVSGVGEERQGDRCARNLIGCELRRHRVLQCEPSFCPIPARHWPREQ
jgi:hypothetical protein